MAAESDQFWKALNRRDIDGVRQELVEKQPNKSERLNMVLDYLINDSERSTEQLKKGNLLFSSIFIEVDGETMKSP